VLKRARWQIPESLPFGADTIVPLAGGETLDWQLV
jgi:dihydroorotase